MKYLILLLFAFATYAQDGTTRFFVDANATGSNNGTSWANAWESFGDIDWADLTSADTVYVSGGTDSIVYAMNTTIDPDPDVSFSPYVVICPSWESGHNGKVVITNSTSNQLSVLLIRGVSGLKMTGFTVRDTRNPATVANGTLLFGDVSNPGHPVTGRIHIDNFHIISNGTVGTLNFECRDTVIISNTNIEFTTNNLLNEADPITFTAGDNYILIEGCTFIQRNTSTETDAHRDMMQFNFDVGLGSTIDVVIRNNIAIQTSTEGTSWNAFVYSSTSAIDTTKWYIYNNIFVSRTTGSPMGGVFLYNDSGVSENYWIFNNTVIMNDAGNGLSRPMNAGNNWTTDTIFFQNNLVIEDGTINLMFSAPIFFYKVYYRLFDYNGWFEYGGLSDPFMNGDGFGSYSYATWQAFADGNDINSITGNSTAVSFTNKYGENKTDYYTETGRDLGTNIGEQFPYLLEKFPDLGYDILGNPRVGTWDIGALEFPTNFRDAVLLTHSSGSRLYDYDAYMGTDSTDISVPLEMDAYNTANSYTGESQVTMEKRWFPNTYGTDWYNWLIAFDGTIDDGSDFWAKLDTFNVVIFKGGIQNTLMTGYGSDADTLEENRTAHLGDETTVMYKWILKVLVDSMANHPETFFVVMTAPPAPERFQTTNGARLSQEFSAWMKDTLATGIDDYGTFPDNIYIFDYFSLMADANGNLKAEYEIPAPAEDFHQNATACDYVAPIFVQEIFDASTAYGGVIPEAGWTAPDTTATVTFTPVTGAELNSYHIAYGVVSGLDSTAHVYTATSDSFAVGYPYTLGLGVQEVENGDTIAISNIASGSYSTANVNYVILSGTSRSFTVTTKAEPVVSSGNGILKGSNGAILRDSTGKVIKTQ